MQMLQPGQKTLESKTFLNFMIKTFADNDGSVFANSRCSTSCYISEVMYGHLNVWASLKETNSSSVFAEWLLWNEFGRRQSVISKDHLFKIIAFSSVDRNTRWDLFVLNESPFLVRTFFRTMRRNISSLLEFSAFGSIRFPPTSAPNNFFQKFF